MATAERGSPDSISPRDHRGGLANLYPGTGGAMDDPSELPQVRIADCGCILPAEAKPVGYRWRLTPTGDARVLVYACSAHDHTHTTAPEPTIPKRPRRAAG